MAPTIGDWLPTVVWPSDVEAKKRQLDPSWRATSGAVEQCARLDPATVKAFRDDANAWRAFYDEPVPTFGAANKWEEAKKFEQRLADWQDKLARLCALPSPNVRPDQGPDTSALKWVAGAVIVAAIVYGVRTVLR